MRALTLAALLALAGCGDDAASPAPDLSVCTYHGVECCDSPKWQNGAACDMPGSYCAEFELSCRCGSDGVVQCYGPFRGDMARPYSD